MHSEWQKVVSNAHLTCSVCRSNAEWSAFNSGPVNIPAATLYPPLRFDQWTGFSKRREVPPQVWLRDKAASCCDCVKGDESASVRESEGSNEVMLIHVHQRTLLICSWHFCIAALNEQLQTERAHVPQRQLWYFLSPHKPPASTHSTWGCGEIGYKTVSNQRNAFLLFHSVFHLDAQLLLKVQKVLLLMAYFTWP